MPSDQSNPGNGVIELELAHAWGVYILWVRLCMSIKILRCLTPISLHVVSSDSGRINNIHW